MTSHDTADSLACRALADVLDEEPGNEVWEPIRFAVGQRIRIRLSGECEWWHGYQPDGSVGVIRDLCYRNSGGDNGGHPYGIDFGPDDGGSTYYAASELIPLDPPADGQEGDAP